MTQHVPATKLQMLQRLETSAVSRAVVANTPADTYAAQTLQTNCITVVACVNIRWRGAPWCGQRCPRPTSAWACCAAARGSGTPAARTLMARGLPYRAPASCPQQITICQPLRKMLCVVLGRWNAEQKMSRMRTACLQEICATIAAGGLSAAAAAVSA